MENKLDFLTSSISDIQATIRAIDVKVAALLVVLLTPFQNLNRIFSHIDHFRSKPDNLILLIIVILFIFSWFISLVALVRAIGAIDNPSRHIINSSNCNGTYYGAGLYQLGFLDVFLNRDIIRASKDPQSLSALIPNNKQNIEIELVFEQMKLIYIRDIKINRLRYGGNFFSIWFILGVLIFISSRYFIK